VFHDRLLGPAELRVTEDFAENFLHDHQINRGCGCGC
jgi:hypothetical protein